MRVYYNDGVITEGPSSAVKRSIKRNKKRDPHLKYKFSGPFTELEQCIYDMRSGYSYKWISECYAPDIIALAMEVFK